MTSVAPGGQEIAIIGMSGRFPGARNLDMFWQNICNGMSAIAFFQDAELLASGVMTEVLQHPHYVKAGMVLDDIDLFDADFFGISPREARLMDPQHRLALEYAWEALEHAGYSPENVAGRIGVYMGGRESDYLRYNLWPHAHLMQTTNWLQLEMANEKDHIPTRVAYKLNLQGPAISVNTACSTALVAVHEACQSLLDAECDMALAGGVTVVVPQRQGYLYEEGFIVARDGYCRAFDAQASGTVMSSGIGLVVLKRYDDALAAGDTIHAIIKGTAINNDGAHKVAYTAPSVAGQAEVIASAQAMAEVHPDSITYVETHGTGTHLGDPVEIEALTLAFRTRTTRCGYCAIGSVKPNIGHTNRAAGIASLLKVVLMLKHGMLPPSLHFEQPNPQIPFATTPFFVNTSLQPWTHSTTPRRAGVSAFGVGGTNAHAVLEEGPLPATTTSTQYPQLLLLSARTASALETSCRNVSEYLKQSPACALADIAYTLQVGRRAFPQRRMLVCSTPAEALTMLDAPDTSGVLTAMHADAPRLVVFHCPDQITATADSIRALYHSELPFAEALNQCANALQPYLVFSVQAALLAEPTPDTAHIRTFAVAYALARLWMRLGVSPAALTGHRVGTYVQAALSGESGELTLTDVGHSLVAALPVRTPDTLAQTAMQHADCITLCMDTTIAETASQPAFSALPDTTGDTRGALLTTLGQLWLAGAAPDWHQLHQGEQRRRVPLPTYPFERQRYWIDPPRTAHAPQALAVQPSAAAIQAMHTGVTARPTFDTPQPAALLDRIQATPPDGRRTLLLTYLRQEIAHVMGLNAPDLIPLQQRLFDFGLDAHMAVELRNRIEASIGQPLRTMLVFDFPTVMMLVTYIEQVVAPFVTVNPATAQTEATEPGAEPSTAELVQLLARKLADLD